MPFYYQYTVLNKVYKGQYFYLLNGKHMNKTSIVSMLAFCCMFFFSDIAFGEGIGSANVKFGKPTNETECIGKGICKLNSISSSGVSGEVPVKFVLVKSRDGSFYTLTLQFSISLMSSADHDYLYANFLYSDGEPRPKYVFDASYTFTDKDICSNLGIDAGTLTVSSSSLDGDRNIEKINDSDIRLTYVIPIAKK